MTITWQRSTVEGEHGAETHYVSKDGRFAITPFWVQSRSGIEKVKKGLHLRDTVTGAGRRYETLADAKHDAERAREVSESAAAQSLAGYFMPNLIRSTPIGLLEVYGETTKGQRVYLGLFSEPIERILPRRERELDAKVQAWGRHMGHGMIERIGASGR